MGQHVPGQALTDAPHTIRPGATKAKTPRGGPAGSTWLMAEAEFVRRLSENDGPGVGCSWAWRTWRRPTLPRLETKYHRRWGVSRPSSEWGRVQPPRNGHQVGQAQDTGLLVRAPRAWSRRAIKPIEPLVPVGSAHRCACTPGLSTWSSSTALKGELVLRRASRLDAFSGYPIRT